MRYKSILAALAFPIFAHASPPISNIDFEIQHPGPLYNTVEKFYGSWEKRETDMRTYESMIDLNNDGRGEIAIKFTGPKVCDDRGCLTIIMMFLNHNWHVIFQQHVHNIRIVSTVYPKAMGQLIINDRHLYAFSPRDKRYEPIMSSFGQAVDMSENAPATINGSELAAKETHIPIYSGDWRMRRICTDGYTDWLLFWVETNNIVGNNKNIYSLIKYNHEGYQFLNTFKDVSQAAYSSKDNKIYIKNKQGMIVIDMEGKKLYTTYPSLVTRSP